MKAIKKISDFNFHLRIFILLSITIWLLVAFIHLKVLVFGGYINLGDMVLPRIVNYLAVFITLWMFVMGLYYYLTLKPTKNSGTK